MGKKFKQSFMLCIFYSCFFSDFYFNLFIFINSLYIITTYKMRFSIQSTLYIVLVKHINKHVIISKWFSISCFLYVLLFSPILDSLSLTLCHLPLSSHTVSGIYVCFLYCFSPTFYWITKDPNQSKYPHSTHRWHTHFHEHKSNFTHPIK